MRLGESKSCEVLQARSWLASEAVLVSARRVTDLLRKYDESQPRVPAGLAGGGQWVGDNMGGTATIDPVRYRPGRYGFGHALEGALTFFTWLSTRNGPGGQGIITFNARDFYPNRDGSLDVDGVTWLDWDQVDSACPHFAEVQTRTDMAARDQIRDLYRGTVLYKGQNRSRLWREQFNSHRCP